MGFGGLGRGWRVLGGREATRSGVFRERVMIWANRRVMYWGSSSRLGSEVMPERGSVVIWYWSMIHSRAERLPRR